MLHKQRWVFMGEVWGSYKMTPIDKCQRDHSSTMALNKKVCFYYLLVVLWSKGGWALTDFSLAESSNMRSKGFLTGSIPSTNTCNHKEGSTLQLHPNRSQSTYHIYSSQEVFHQHLTYILISNNCQTQSFITSNTKSCKVNSTLVGKERKLWRPGWWRDVPWPSSWRWCRAPRGKRSGSCVYWRYEAWPGSASWCCSLSGPTPGTVMKQKDFNLNRLIG